VRGSESNSDYPATIPTQVPGAAVRWALSNDFDWRTFDFDLDMTTVDDQLAGILNANTADLEEFKSHGGKLLLWQGFADPQIPVLNTIAWYERLIASQMRDDRHDKAERKEALRHTQEFARMFLAPGVGHCGGGAGPDTVDFHSVGRAGHRTRPDHRVKSSQWRDHLFPPALSLSGTAALQRRRRSDTSQQLRVRR